MWAKAANSATILENTFLAQNGTLRPFQHFLGKGKESILSLMQNFGEMCLTTYRDNTHWAKLANCGAQGTWIGYTDGHPTGTCQIFNCEKKDNLTQDVTFLWKSDYNTVEKPVLITMSYEGDDDKKSKTVTIVSHNDNDSNKVKKRRRPF